MTSPEETDSWYPSNYWVPENVADQRPLRYGDLVAAPANDRFGRTLDRELTDSKTGNKILEPWFAVICPTIFEHL